MKVYFQPKTMKIYNVMTFLCTKPSTLPDYSFICPLERVCLTLQNTLNLDKWQNFKISLKCYDFPFNSNDAFDQSYKIGFIFYYAW